MLDVYVKGLATLASIGFAVTFYRAGGRETRLLASFLGLIALNQGAETIAAATTGAVNYGFSAVGTVAAAFDPLLFVAFATAYARRTMGRPLRIALTTVSVLLALTAPFYHPAATPQVADGIARAALGVYTGLAYALATSYIITARRDIASLRPIVIACAIAALPAAARAAGQVTDVMTLLIGVANDAVILGAAHALGVLTISLWFLRVGRGRVATVVRPGLLVGVGTILLLDAYVIDQIFVMAGILPDFPLLSVFGRAGAAIRWLAFGALVSTAVVRDSLLDLPLAHRRQVARVQLALLFLILGFILVAALQRTTGTPTFSLRPVEMALLLGILLLSQGARDLLDSAAYRVYGVPRPRDDAARRAAYRGAVLEATAIGTSAAQAKLGRLRDELGLDDAAARSIATEAEAESPVPLEPGRMFAGRYEVRAVVGRGGGGRALLAHDMLVGRDVILKEVRVDGLTREEHALREARAMGALRHPHVVTLYDVLSRRGGHVLVLERAEGGTLSERMEAGGLSDADAVRTLLDVLAGSAAAHERGIVHRDVKPSNILFSGDGRAMVTDFGLAKLGALDETRRLVGWGTPRFAAPEQLAGGDVTPAADVYAIGAVGDLILGKDAPAAVREVIVRAMSIDPAKRWADARAMREALVRVTASGAADSAPPR